MKIKELKKAAVNLELQYMFMTYQLLKVNTENFKMHLRI